MVGKCFEHQLENGQLNYSEQTYLENFGLLDSNFLIRKGRGGALSLTFRLFEGS